MTTFEALADEKDLSRSGEDTAVACATAELNFGSAALAELEEPSEASGFCPGSFCDTDADCESACPHALSATCSVSSTCAFTFPGGGGGSGELCRAFCFTNADCQSACPNTPGVYCSAYTCRS